MVEARITGLGQRANNLGICSDPYGVVDGDIRAGGLRDAVVHRSRL